MFGCSLPNKNEPVEAKELIYDATFFQGNLPKIKILNSKLTSKYKSEILPENCYATLSGDSLHVFFNSEGKMTYYIFDYLIYQEKVKANVELRNCVVFNGYLNIENRLYIDSKSFKIKDSIRMFIESTFISDTLDNPPHSDTIILKGLITLQIREKDYSIEKRMAEYAYQDILNSVIENSDTITEIDLSGLYITQIPNEILKLKKLKKLKLNYLKLDEKEFEKLKNFENLEELSLNDCGLKQIPSQLTNLEKLKILDLSNNPIEESDLINLLPLSQLKEIDLSNCGLKTIPINFRDFVKLEELSLSYNLLKSESLPLICAQDLKILDISHNKIREIPSSFFDSKKLVSLNLSSNRIFNFPMEIKMLRELRELDFKFNQFESFPSVLNEMQPLDYIGMIGNKFKAKDFER